MEVADNLVDCVVAADVLACHHRLAGAVKCDRRVNGSGCAEQRLPSTDSVGQSGKDVEVERLDLEGCQTFGEFLKCQGSAQATR